MAKAVDFRRCVMGGQEREGELARHHVSEIRDTIEGMAFNSRVRLVDEVADVLREWICHGRLAPGSPLRQGQLATELNVSRTPLREALRMLEREGLVEVEPLRGVRVISADLASLRAAYVLREVIDGLAARLAAKRATREFNKRLRDLVRRQADALTPWNTASYTALNVEFHDAILSAAGNAFLTRQRRLVAITSQVFTPVAGVNRDRAEGAIGEHHGIAEAIRQGQSEQAELLAREHIRQTIVRISQGDVEEWPEARGS